MPTGEAQLPTELFSQFNRLVFLGHSVGLPKRSQMKEDVEAPYADRTDLPGQTARSLLESSQRSCSFTLLTCSSHSWVLSGSESLASGA